MNVEAVSYISALGEPLFVFFGLMALLLFQKKSGTKQAVLVGTLLLCTLFAKETSVVFFIVLISYYLLFARKQWKPLMVISLTAIPFIFYLFMRFAVAKVHIEKIPDVPMMTAPLAERIFTMPAIFWFYINTFFFPKDLFILQLWSIHGLGSQFYLPLALSLFVLLGISALGVWIWKTNKHNLAGFIFFTIWFLCGIGVHMQLIPLDFTVADRYFYFPMMGLLGLLSISFYNLKKVSLPLKHIGMTIAVLIILVFSVRTLIRNTNWYNGLSLYSNDVGYRQSDRIENWLAIELVNAGRYPEADQHFEALLKRNPKEPALYANLAGIYALEGKLAQAEDVYRRGLAMDDSGAVYYALAVMLFQREGKFAEARAISEDGLTKFPQNGTLWFIQALADYKLGNKKKALEEIQRAKELIPNPTTEKAYDTILKNLPL
jgi:Tfp pilus assembly protein PilF